MNNNEEQFLTSPDDEQLIAQFFSDHAFDVPDDGFSRRVMRRLPAPTCRRVRWWRWTCIALGVAWFLFAGGLRTILVFLSAIPTLLHAGAESLYPSFFLVSPVAIYCLVLTLLGLTLHNLVVSGE